jgi:hypothetical protein
VKEINLKAFVLAMLALLATARAGALEPERVLPFELSQQLPLLKLQVDDRPATLILDLGGAAPLALRPDWPADDPKTDARTKRVRLPGGELETLPATVWKRTSIPPGIDGYLGFAYLQRFNLVFDYAKRQARLYPRGAAHGECRAKPAALSRLGSLPYVQFDYSGQTLLMGLDTGANQNLIKPGRPGTALSDTKRSIDGASLAAQATTPGPLLVMELPIPTLDGLLGYDFFARYRVCLDPAANTLAADAF